MALLALRRSLAVLLALCLFFSPTSAKGNVQAVDEAAIRALVDHYFSAYSREDLDAIAQLWSDKSPNLGAAKGRLKEFFSIRVQQERSNETGCDERPGRQKIQPPVLLGGLHLHRRSSIDPVLNGISTTRVVNGRLL